VVYSRPLKSQILGDYKAMSRRRIYIRQGEINTVIDQIWLLPFLLCFILKLNIQKFVIILFYFYGLLQDFREAPRTCWGA